MLAPGWGECWVWRGAAGDAGGEALDAWRHGLLWKHSPFLQHSTVALPLHADPLPQVHRAPTVLLLRQCAGPCCIDVVQGDVAGSS